MSDSGHSDPSVSILSKKRDPLLYAVFLTFGIASLTPWNCFITATEYFEHKFNASSSADIRENFPKYFQICGIVGDVATSLLCMIVVKYIKISTMVYFANVQMLVAFVVTTCLAKVDTDDWPNTYFAVTVTLFAMMCSGGAMYISAMFAMVSTMSSVCTDGFLVGMALAGLFASMLNIGTLSLPGTNSVEAGFWYFLIATIVLTIALGLFTVFQRSDMSYERLESEFSNTRTAESSPGPESRASDPLCETEDETVSEDVSDKKLVRSSTTGSAISLPMTQLFRAAWQHIFSFFFVLLVTFTIFPGALSMLKSDALPGTAWADKYFIPVSLFLVFNIGDCLGRILVSWVKWPSERFLIYYGLARIVFILLLVMCNLQPRSVDVWFSGDVWPTVLIFLFALTNGQVISLSMVYAPQCVQNKCDKAAIGTIQAFCSAIGRVTGSFLAFLAIAAIK